MYLIDLLGIFNIAFASIWLVILSKEYDGFSLKRNTLSHLALNEATRPGFIRLFVIFSLLQAIFAYHATQTLAPYHLTELSAIFSFGAVCLLISSAVNHLNPRAHQWLVGISIVSVATGVMWLSAVAYTNHPLLSIILLTVSMVFPVSALIVKLQYLKPWWEIPVVGMVILWNVITIVMLMQSA